MELQMNYETLSPDEKWNQAGLSNNFIFYKVFRNNPKECKHLLELLLGFKINRIEISQEETVLTDPNSKGIRMDLYIQNQNECIDLELQAINTKELPERARYYQSVMDVDSLKAGKAYKELKTSYVIFICMSDIYGKGYPLYTFQNTCQEDNSISMGDRTYKLFYICENSDKLLNVNQRNFFNLLNNKQPEDKFTKQLQKLIEDAKHNSQWRMQYMEYERQRTYDREAGYEKGKEEKSIEDAKAFLLEGIKIETISKCIGIPIEKVRELQNQIK